MLAFHRRLSILIAAMVIGLLLNRPVKAGFYATSLLTNGVVQYDDSTGAPLGTFASGGGLGLPVGLAFGPDNNLYVSSYSTDQVLRFDGRTGAFLGGFATVNAPTGLAFGPDGNLYVSDSRDNTIIHYNGSTGASLGTFASGSILDIPYGLTFGPSGDLYVAATETGVLRYDGRSGAFLGQFNVGGDLRDPGDLTFGPDGKLYVSSYGTNKVERYDGRTGSFLDVFASGGGVSGPAFITFGPNAVMNYESTHGCFPSGGYPKLANPASSFPLTDHSLFERIGPFLEQGVLFNAINFDLDIYRNENLTVIGIGSSVLWCPSDPTVSTPTALIPDAGAAVGITFSSWMYPAPRLAGNWTQQHKSYRGITGIWAAAPFSMDPAEIQRARANCNGVIFQNSNTRIAEITDGTSNTMFLDERAHAYYSNLPQVKSKPSTAPYYAAYSGAWTYGIYTYDGIYTYAPNRPSYPVTPSSFHPGGINVALCDGSVRFLKSSIDAYAPVALFTPASPIVFDVATRNYSLVPGIRVPVYPALATSAGGEIISADSN